MRFHVGLQLPQGLDERRNATTWDLATLEPVRLVRHDDELGGELLVLLTELVDEGVQRGFGSVQGREQVVLFRLVMLVEELRVGVDGPKQFVTGSRIGTGGGRESQEIRVMADELLVRRLERCDDRSVTREADEQLEHRIRVLVRSSGVGRHMSSMRPMRARH